MALNHSCEHLTPQGNSEDTYFVFTCRVTSCPRKGRASTVGFLGLGPRKPSIIDDGDGDRLRAPKFGPLKPALNRAGPGILGPILKPMETGIGR